MFDFLKPKKHTLIESGILIGATDVHSHILPTVDDGSPDYVHSLKMLSYLEQLGYKEIWFTPHTMEDLLQNTDEYLTQRFNEFKQQYKGDLTLHIASEYMMDGVFLPMVENHKVLPLGNQKNHLLVETSYIYGPSNLNEILETVFNSGLEPVIAHPERYMYMEWEDFVALKDKGYHFQINLNSFSGYYGQRPMELAEEFLENGMADYVGTDIHHLGNYAHSLESIKLKAQQLDQVAQLLLNNKTL